MAFAFSLRGWFPPDNGNGLKSADSRRRFGLENLEQRCVYNAAPWSVATAPLVGNISPASQLNASELSPLASDGLPMPSTPVFLDPPFIGVDTAVAATPSVDSPTTAATPPVQSPGAKPASASSAVVAPVYPYTVFGTGLAARTVVASINVGLGYAAVPAAFAELMQQSILLPAPSYTRSVIDEELQWRFNSLEPGARRESDISQITSREEDREPPAYKWVNESFGPKSQLQGGSWLLGKAFAATMDVNQTATPPLFGLADATPLAGDFNGDGRAELVLFRNGEWFIDTNNNGVWDDGDTWTKFGAHGDQPIAGDFNGDGRAELGIVVQPPRKQLSTSAANVDAQPGVPPEQGAAHSSWLPIAADFTGDGIATRGLFRNGTWRFEQPLSGTCKVAKVITFGQANDRPVVGDFDGDGVDEIGVFRDGHWIIDSNHNGAIDAADKVFELGAVGDQPVVADFNGDGIDDPAVYHADNASPAARITRKQ